jgi:L-ribulokinase
VVYRPSATHQPIYDQMFAEYSRLHDYFGRGENPLMKNLRRIQKQARNQALE